jgi:putative glutamine amidotransferase
VRARDRGGRGAVGRDAAARAGGRSGAGVPVGWGGALGRSGSGAAAYGAQEHVELGATEPGLDACEYAIAREALRLELPILGICPGAQALNVARGGTLHRHLTDVVGDAIAHRQSEDGRRPTHVVDVLPGSRLADVLGTARLNVNSFHHQAVDCLGTGLPACAWAPDGSIEAIEDCALPFVVAVQWHAEILVWSSQPTVLCSMS